MNLYQTKDKRLTASTLLGYGLALILISIVVIPPIPVFNLGTRALEVRISDFLSIFLVLLVYCDISLKGRLILTPTARWFGYFLASALISTLVGSLVIQVSENSLLVGLFFWLRNVQYFLIFITSIYLARHSPKRSNKIIYALIIGLFIVAIYIGWQAITGLFTYKGIRAGMLSDLMGPNVTGAYLSIFAPIAFSFYIGKRSIRYLFLLCIILISIGFTGSRSSLFGASVGVLAIFIPQRINHKKSYNRWVPKLLLIVAISIAVLFIGSIDNTPAPLRRLTKFTGGGDFPSTKISLRLRKWSFALQSFFNRPLIGKGLSFVNSQQWAECQYLSLLSEQGIVGLTLFFILILALVKEVYLRFLRFVDPTWRYLALGYIGSIASLLSVSLFGSRFLAFQVAVPFWILGGLITGRSLKNEDKNSKERPK